jgi:hypothetical protein
MTSGSVLLPSSVRQLMTCMHMHQFERRQQQAVQPLSGKVALITGATTGIGLATADHLAGGALHATGIGQLQQCTRICPAPAAD